MSGSIQRMPTQQRRIGKQVVYPVFFVTQCYVKKEGNEMFTKKAKGYTLIHCKIYLTTSSRLF